MVELIKNTDGLKPQHVPGIPIFEKMYMPPEYGDKLISRVYSDGSLYYLAQPRGNSEYFVQGEKWSFIGCLSKKGTKDIELKIDRICKNIPQNSLQNTTTCEIHWKFNYKNKLYEFIIVDGSDSKIQMFDEITTIVNSE